MKSKDRIIFEAFKLFCEKPYDQVTFADLEAATNLSRGAILYHFKAKENIFYRVIENYVLANNTITLINKEKRENLQEFIAEFIEQVKINKLEMKKWGIKNMNKALLHIESSAYAFYPEVKDKAEKWYIDQFNVWEEVISKAVKNREIRSDINITVIARLFEKVYFGLSFLSIPYIQGIEIEELQNDFREIYNLLK